MNRLANETSPYLLQHAENPVHWHAWGEEALAEARQRDVPILLSIGYSACHWCHVMEHESFADQATADVMNELFVSVKVDREERPDLDGIYMDAVVALTGQGGWPMTVFLTPECKPFYGGTYFPPEPRMGMPAFTELIKAVSDAYRDRRGEVTEQAAKLVEALNTSSTVAADTEGLGEEILSRATAGIAEQFDHTYGGFGQAPKFPPAPSIEFLLRMHLRGNPIALEMATLTLDQMAAGGVYDHIGGGFHRYAVDQIWLVPHFEKMLYDNALLASAYLHAWQVTGTPRYRQVVEETLDYLLRRMRLPGGAIASAEDADTEGHEGLTYVWTPDELRDVLEADEVEAIERFYGIEPGGNFEGRSIPHDVGAEDVDNDLLVAARLKLRDVRDQRPQPFLDDKVVVAWNGLALAAFAEAGAKLERSEYVDAAAELAAFLATETATPDGRLLRTWRDGTAKVPGYLEDYANVAHGLLELHAATGATRYLIEARRLADLAIELFGDEENGGFFFTAHDSEALIVRKKELDDHPTPSGNSMMASVLL
ncbi:MAG: thioredoxin domain-containing protein, partial [Gaiellaceae bacterium]